MTLNDVLDLVEADLLLHRRASLATFASQCRPLRAALGSRRARALKTRELQAYQRRRLAEGAAAQTVNLELGYLRRGYRLAVEQEILVSIPHVRRLSVQNARQGFVEPEGFRCLANALPELLRDLATWAYFTGWRLREIRQLRWIDIRAEVAVCRAEASKTRHEKLAPLGDVLRQVLARRWEARLGPGGAVAGLVFQVGGLPVGDFRRPWQRASRAAGLEGLHFHDLRRSFVRNAIRAGVPQSVVMALSGHRTQAVFHRYNIVSGRDLLLASQALSDYNTAAIKGRTDNEPQETRLSS